MNRYIIFFLTIVVMTFSGCEEEKSETKTVIESPVVIEDINTSTRSFYLGFTPWPYAATLEAINDVYSKIQKNGDLVAHHLDGGIPWQELATDSAYHENVENDIQSRIDATNNDKIIYLAISPLNSARNDLVGHWGEENNEALLESWRNVEFNDTAVIDAYSKFSLDLIERFEPKYFNYGVEINELMINSPVKFDAYVGFIKEVSTRIRAVHPDIRLMVSLALKTPNSQEMIITKKGYKRIEKYVDIVGVSSYGYVFYNHENRGNPDNLPINWLSQINDITSNTPFAITETGWIAEDMNLSSYSLHVSSNSVYQKKYVEKLLSEAQALNSKFVVWFSIVDYDNLWSNILGDDISKIWRDTGLFDESLNERESLNPWNMWLEKEYRE